MAKSGWWSFCLSPEVQKRLAKNGRCAILIKSYLAALVQQGARFARTDGRDDPGLSELYDRDYLTEPKDGTYTIGVSDLCNLSALPFVEILRRNENWPMLPPWTWTPERLNPGQLKISKAAHIKRGMDTLTNHLTPYFMDTEEDWYIFDRYAIAPARDKDRDNFIDRRMLPLVLIFQLIDRVRAGKESTIHICCWSTNIDPPVDEEKIVAKFRHDIETFKNRLNSPEVQELLNANRGPNPSSISMKFYNKKFTTDLKLNNHERFLVGKYCGLLLGNGLEEFSKCLLRDKDSMQLAHMSIFPSTAYMDAGQSRPIAMELIDKIARAGVDWCNSQRPADEITI